MFERPTHPKDQWAFAVASAILGFAIGSVAPVEPIPRWAAIISPMMALFIGAPMLACVLALCRELMPRISRALRLLFGSIQVGGALGMVLAWWIRDDVSTGSKWDMTFLDASQAIAGFVGARLVDDTLETTNDELVVR
jgi:hypothetical protein